MKRATLEKRPQDMSSMFDEVAAKYDIMNTLLTGGLVHVWRSNTRDAVGARRGLTVLDLACGTGSSTNDYAKAGADVIGCDISEGMITRGKVYYPHLTLIQGDATDLPFGDGTFDIVTISYGLRNVQNTEKALSEMFRVTKPGGKVVIAEFSKPATKFFRNFYRYFMATVMPYMARRISSDPEAYAYLFESILDWHGQKKLAELMQDAGWRGVEYKNLCDGIVAIHRGIRPKA
ncbi:MAG: class I SAM-dependent methyltransferase [Arcanobacterium sp.]